MKTIPNFQVYSNYSNRNYGVNALVFTDNKGNEWYFSYKTLVAFRTIKTGLVCIENYWGPTTGKHLNAIQPDKSKRVNQNTFDIILNSIGGAE